MESFVARPLMLLLGRRWWVGMALATGVGLLQTASEWIGGESFVSIALSCLLWVFETPLQVFALSLVFTYGVRRRVGAVNLLIACLLVAVALGSLFGVAFVSLFEGMLGFALDEKGPLSPPLAAGFGAISGLLLAGIWGLAFVSPHLTEQAQLRSLETEQLRLEAEQLRVASELGRLRSQLEPHFLLNTLNTIAGLVTQDPREARRLLGCLGDLLRDSLHEQEEMQTLDQEVTWLRRYAEILESRHGEAVRFDWDIARDAGGVLLPRLLLQPLVENAVQHGALCRRGGGRVSVHAELSHSGAGLTLRCTVADNGPGVATSEPRQGAVGLHVVRRRLELRCPGSALRLRSTSEGTLAIVEIPVLAAAA
jgi:two-component sensor histidine kinase